MPRARLDDEHEKIRTGTLTDVQFRRLLVQCQRGQGQTHPRKLAGLKLENSETVHPSPISGSGSLCRIGLLTATEKQVHLGRLHMRLIGWHLKNHWMIWEPLEKVILQERL